VFVRERNRGAHVQEREREREHKHIYGAMNLCLKILLSGEGSHLWLLVGQELS
jgi:hypothetical protein